MKAKKLFSILVAGGLVASGFTSLPAGAAPPTEPPETVQIEDPFGDSNFLNDQDNAPGTPLQGEGDHPTPADVGSVTDLGKVWFSHTAEEITLNIQTEAAPSADLVEDIYYRFATNPGTGPEGTDDTRGCLFWIAIVNGQAGAWTGPDTAFLEDSCNATEIVEAKLEIGELADGTGVVTITAPRSYSPLLVNGGSVTGPYGVARVLIAGPGLPGLANGLASAATADTTKRGTDYLISGGEVAGPPEEEPPGKSEPPGKKKGCDKGKGKKKGCKKGGGKTPPGLACDPFTPGEAGADQPTVIVTDAATEEAPVEQTVTLGESLGDLDLVGMLPAPFDSSTAAFNIQVDSASADAGLYASIEFDTRRDYDLNLLHPDGSYAARSRGWNTFVDTPAEGDVSADGHGGDATDHSETLVGIKTSDCGGWTLRAENWLGEGGDFAVKLWLGEVKNEPQAEGEEPG